jgi:putative tryptophan/tyrosine transport system substrate-binding protein
MKRRHFLKLLGIAAIGWPGVSSNAQQTGKTWRIGQVLGGTPGSAGGLAAALERQLADLGYVQGKNLLLLNRFALPQLSEMENAIRGVVSSIDLLVVWGTIGGVAAKNVVQNMPVVFLSVGAPVNIGLVESLSHPGGNMTGITFEAAEETYAKRLQILKEIVPGATRIAVLGAKGDANVQFAMPSIERAARSFGVTLVPIEVISADDLNRAFDEMKRNQAEALIVIAGALTYVNGRTIADLAMAYHLPACHAFKETVAVGGLVSLGPDLVAMTAQGAVYVDKILHGVNPAELPVQQPARYELHVNLKTAETLGLRIPGTLLTRADEVIE